MVDDENMVTSDTAASVVYVRGVPRCFSSPIAAVPAEPFPAATI